MVSDDIDVFVGINCWGCCLLLLFVVVVVAVFVLLLILFKHESVVVSVVCDNDVLMN